MTSGARALEVEVHDVFLAYRPQHVAEPVREQDVAAQVGGEGESHPDLQVASVIDHDWNRER